MEKPHERDAVQQDSPKRLSFAYGSNINPEQMAYRCPDAQVVGPVMLEGYRATGIELSDVYAQRARERIEAAVKEDN